MGKRPSRAPCSKWLPRWNASAERESRPARRRVGLATRRFWLPTAPGRLTGCLGNRASRNWTRWWRRHGAGIRKPDRRGDCRAERDAPAGFASALRGASEHGVLPPQRNLSKRRFQRAEAAVQGRWEVQEILLIVDRQSRFAKQTARLGGAKQDRIRVYRYATDEQSRNRIVRVVLDDCQSATGFQDTTRFPDQGGPGQRRDVVKDADRRHEIEFGSFKRNLPRVVLNARFNTFSYQFACLEHARRRVASGDPGEIVPQE